MEHSPTSKAADDTNELPLLSDAVQALAFLERGGLIRTLAAGLLLLGLVLTVTETLIELFSVSGPSIFTAFAPGAACLIVLFAMFLRHLSWRGKQRFDAKNSRRSIWTLVGILILTAVPALEARKAKMVLEADDAAMRTEQIITSQQAMINSLCSRVRQLEQFAPTEPVTSDQQRPLKAE